MALYSYSMVDLATLVVQETKEAIYKTALGIATNIGLPVTSWQPGDPTRSLLLLEAELLEKLEEVVVGYIRAGFLDWAAEIAEEGLTEQAKKWLIVLAKQQFNVDVPGATYATTDVELTNTTANFYGEIGAGDITFKNSTTGKTYRNTSGGDLASGPGTTLTVSIEADEAGSESSAGAGEIDTIVTGPNGVTCTNATAAVGNDAQQPSVTVAQCRAKLDSLSPNGPKGAYEYVARNPTLTTTPNITRARAFGDSDTGDVTVYLASASGGVTEPDRVLAETAILAYATPLCITPTVLAAVNVPVPVTYELWVYTSVNRTAAEIEEAVEAALETMLASQEIGGDIIPPATTGNLYLSLIESTILSTFEQAFRVEVSTPAADVALDNGDVATLGTITATVHLVVAP